jgi:hypothetical protein
MLPVAQFITDRWCDQYHMGELLRAAQHTWTAAELVVVAGGAGHCHSSSSSSSYHTWIDISSSQAGLRSQIMRCSSSSPVPHIWHSRPSRNATVESSGCHVCVLSCTSRISSTWPANWTRVPLLASSSASCWPGSRRFLEMQVKRTLQNGHLFSVSDHLTMHRKQNLRHADNHALIAMHCRLGSCKAAPSHLNSMGLD